MSDEPESGEDLAARVAELEETVRRLQREAVRPPRGPLGLPRPPTPRELLAFTDEHAIPTVVAFLDAHVRALEALGAAIRLARGADDAGERAADAGERTRALGSAAVDAVDDALADLRDAYREGRLPNNPDARRLLEDADRLTDEIRGELDAAEDRERGAGEADRGSRPTRPSVDVTEVETELEMLRDEYADGEDGAPGDAGADGAPGQDADAEGDGRTGEPGGDSGRGDDGGADESS